MKSCQQRRKAVAPPPQKKSRGKKVLSSICMPTESLLLFYDYCLSNFLLLTNTEKYFYRLDPVLPAESELLEINVTVLHNKNGRHD